jgi:hypothetical protein
MGILDRLRGLERTRWFVCYNCMMQTGHDTPASIFYTESSPVLVLGRPVTPCPRCGDNNTKSFQTLKDEGAEAPLWGLEQTVRKFPRSKFVVKPAAVSTCGAPSTPPAQSGTRQ